MPGKRILLVDDEPLVAGSVRMTLESEGYEVVYAESAAKAICLYEPGKFDLVITDHRMPHMTGLELAGHLKSINQAQPIVMLTGFPPGNAYAVVDAVVMKPFETAHLRETVRRLSRNGSNPIPS